MRHPEELISVYLDGELTALERHSLMSHLGECGRCSRELTELQAIRAAVRALPIVDMPEGLVPEADAVVVPLHRNRGVWVGAAAAIIAFVVAVATVFGPTPPTVTVSDLNSRLGARVSLDPAFGPAKVVIPDITE